MDKYIKSKPVLLTERDSVGSRVRNNRLRYGYAQWKLANICYMSPTSISKIELDLKSPSIEDLCAIAKALHVRLIDLIPEDMMRGIL